MQCALTIKGSLCLLCPWERGRYMLESNKKNKLVVSELMINLYYF